jgi:hypothetical protein
MAMSMTDLQALTDAALIYRIAVLARIERETAADLVAHLVELERRNLHLACGFKSLYSYCRRVLHCSEGGSYDRMRAAHAARRFPVVLALLAAGKLHITAVRLLSPHLRDEDHLALLGGAIHKSAEEVRELLARWFPRADVAPSIRRLPKRKRGSEDPAGAAASAATSQAAPVAASPVTPAAALPAAPVAASPAALPPAASPPASADGEPSSAPSAVDSPPTAPPASEDAKPKARTLTVPKRPVEPLAADRYAVRFTADEETVSLLREAQDLLSHSVPDGDVALLVKRGLRLLVAEARRQRFSAAVRPRRPRSVAPEPGPAAPATRGRSAEVERAVWSRDGGRCSYIGRDGRRCEERRSLQYHHLRPWIVGGPQTVVNLALRCAAHNRYEADVYFAPIRRAMDQ